MVNELGKRFALSTMASYVAPNSTSPKRLAFQSTRCARGKGSLEEIGMMSGKPVKLPLL